MIVNRSCRHVEFNAMCNLYLIEITCEFFLIKNDVVYEALSSSFLQPFHVLPPPLNNDLHPKHLFFSDCKYKPRTSNLLETSPGFPQKCIKNYRKNKRDHPLLITKTKETPTQKLKKPPTQPPSPQASQITEKTKEITLY